MYGKAEVYISRIVVPGGDTPFITNNSNPKGGVVKLISKERSIISANQIGSNPSVWAKGKKIGTVSSIIDICSINIPSSKSTANITSSIASGARSKLVAQLTNPREAPEKASNWLNVAEPKTMR